MSWGKPVIRKAPPKVPVSECPPIVLRWVCIGGNPLCEYQDQDLTCRWHGACRHKERVMVRESKEAGS